jgi:hypothetical protein
VCFGEKTISEIAVTAEITTNVNTLWGFRHSNKRLPFC